MENEINVIKIMEDIKEQISKKDKEYDLKKDVCENSLNVNDIYIKEYLNQITYCNSLSNVKYFRAINGNICKTCVKRLIRKIILFIILPIVIDQNEFNSNITSIIELQEKQILKLQETIQNLEKR